MKTTKLIYPLALALAVTLVGAGCKHPQVKTTQLPATSGAPISDQGNQQTQNNPQQLPTTTPITPDQNPGNVNTTPPPFQNDGHLATSDTWSPDDPNLVADRATLAANTVHFAFDSATVKTGEQANIQAVATALTSDLNVKLLIEGHCDERGTEEYNRSLGERRALALREALVKMNIDSKRIRTISYGKDKPADPGHDDAAFTKNRRGEFVLYHPKAGV